MTKSWSTSWEWLAVLGTLLLVGSGCDTGVSSSPDPGVVRLVLQADPADDSIRIAGKQYVLGNDTTEALLQLDISLARVYRDTNYAELTRELRSIASTSSSVDVLESNQSGSLQSHTLYESFLPPAEYDSLRLALEADQFRIQSFGEAFSSFNFDRKDDELQLAPGLSAAFTFPQNPASSLFPFEITSNDTTIIRMEVKPLSSLNRSVDNYLFAPQIEVTDVTRRAGG